MDLMTVSVKENVKSVHIMWGQVTKLECTDHLVTIPDIFSEPLVFDYNKNSVSDLLAVDKDGNRTVYVFPKPRGIYHKEYLRTGKTNPLKAEHGNSFVDITGDGIADLVLTTSEGQVSPLLSSLSISPPCSGLIHLTATLTSVLVSQSGWTSVSRASSTWCCQCSVWRSSVLRLEALSCPCLEPL